MIKSAILVEISTATGESMPVDIKGIDALVKKVCRVQTENRAIWETLSKEAQNYLIECLRDVKSGKVAPLPGDFTDTTEKIKIRRPRKKAKPEESEDDDQAFHLNRINCKPSVKIYHLGSLLESRKTGDIEVPGFQRKEIWGKRNKIKFLRGVLRGFSLSNIAIVSDIGYVDELTGEQTKKKTRKFLLDGLQRLSTLQAFMNNEIEVDGYYFKDLDQDDKDLFLYMDVPVTEYVTAEENWPELFEYINTSGVPLNDIELRRAIFGLKIINYLEKLTEEHHLWLELYGVHKRYKGLALILRAVLVDYGYADYKKPMTKFMNKVCVELRKNPDAIDCHEIYVMVDKILFAIRNRAKTLFRTSATSQMNQGMVDCIFHAGFNILRNMPDLDSNKLEEMLVTVSQELLNDPEILRSITKDTSGTEATLSRMAKTDEIVIGLMR